MTLNVSDIGEKELIKYIVSNCSTIIPDDAAISKFNNTNLISTTDLLIQSRHFPENMSYFEMGFKAVSVNVSDLAAMGSKPHAFLLAIAIPKDFAVDYFKEMVDGVLDACNFYNIPLIGGDTNEASEIIISGTALGLCDAPLRLDAYNKGDLIAITGNIGFAALGFNLKSHNNIYTNKALKPIARINEGIKIKEAGATSATDITDGLVSELYTMKKEGFGFRIYEEMLEISEEYKNIASELGLNYLDLILNIGEDFELLFTISKENIEKLDIDYKVIGEVTSTDTVEIVLSNGFIDEIENKGYEHYVSE